MQRRANIVLDSLRRKDMPGDSAHRGQKVEDPRSRDVGDIRATNRKILRSREAGREGSGAPSPPCSLARADRSPLCPEPPDPVPVNADFGPSFGG